MIQYITIDAKMAKLILQKFSRHLWYSSEEAIGMAFFDNQISDANENKNGGKASFV